MKTRKTPRRKYTYGRWLRREETGLLEHFGDADLFQEIHLQRIFARRLASRLKSEGDNLSFRDFLAGIRTETMSVSCIARLQKTQFILYDPLLKLARDLSELRKEANNSINKMLEPFRDENGNLPQDLQKYKVNPFDEALEELGG